MQVDWTPGPLSMVVFLATFLLGPCPLSAVKAQAQVASPAACARNVDGDSVTALRHLRKGRNSRALWYIQGIADCPDAIESDRFLDAARLVYEEVGWLNEAWAVWRVASDRLSVGEEAPKRETLNTWIQYFEKTYVLLEHPAGSSPPSVSYAGPFVDPATRHQLQRLSQGSGVEHAPGMSGYWLFPGRYKIDGTVSVLRGGQRISATGP